MIRRLLSLCAAAFAALTFSNCAAPPGVQSDTAVGAFRAAGSLKNSYSHTSPMRLSAPQDRKGLATGWGRTEEDRVGRTVFERDSARPVGVAKVFYNDSEGARAMAGGDWSYSNSFRDYAGGIFRVGLRNHRGAALSAYQSGGNLICIGEGGQRYSVEVENLSNHRLEFVVTVDGLDVLSGENGSYNRRGYVLGPGDRKEIKGWRTSESEVATFKFGSVSDSYVQKTTGSSRNVGVIGTAVFSEKGTSPRPYAGTDGNRRLNASPFIANPEGSGFAKPPRN